MEPGQAFRIISKDVREDFEGHVPVELGVPCPIHLTHAALANEGGDFVGAEAGARAEGHGKMGPEDPAQGLQGGKGKRTNKRC